MNLLTVLSFPMTRPSFPRTVDLLCQSLALETQFIILVSKFLREAKSKYETADGKASKLKKMEHAVDTLVTATVFHQRIPRSISSLSAM